MRRLLVFIMVVLFSMGFTSSPSNRFVPEEFTAKIDPSDIDYDLLQKAVEYQVHQYRRKRRYSELVKSDKLHQLLSLYAVKFENYNFTTDARKVTTELLATYHLQARKIDYFRNWFNVGISQRFAMNYFGFQPYFFDENKDKHQSNFFFGSKIWVEKEKDLTKPVYKETYWKVAKDLLQKSANGPRSRGVFRAQSEHWAIKIFPSSKNSKKKIPEIQLLWISSAKLSARVKI